MNGAPPYNDISHHSKTMSGLQIGLDHEEAGRELDYMNPNKKTDSQSAKAQ